MRALKVKRLIAGAAGLMVAGGLGGCISLLPKTKPVQLYRFGDTVAAASAESAGAPAPRRNLGVALGPIGFPRAAVSDQLLTVTGDTAAYISGARWVSPASVLFQEDVEQAFDRQARSVKLLQRGELGQARALLRLDVRMFEARYESGPAAPPVVVVSVHADLSRLDGQALDDRTFEVRQPAGENRVAAIVQGFDQATDKVLSQIIAWTEQTAALAPAGVERTASPLRAPAVTRSTTTRSTTVSSRPPG